MMGSPLTIAPGDIDQFYDRYQNVTGHQGDKHESRQYPKSN
jgi:hypothetical protein